MATNNAANYSPLQYYTQTGGANGALNNVSPGTSGYVLTSNGASAQPTYQTPTGPSGLNYVKVSLTSTEIKSLVASPKVLVAAQGSGTVIIPLSISAKFTYGGTNVFTNGQTLRVRYGSNTAVSVTSQNLVTITMITASQNLESFQSCFTDASAIGIVTTIAENVQLNLHNQGTEITGNAANNNTLDIYLMYYVLTL